MLVMAKKFHVLKYSGAKLWTPPRTFDNARQ